MTRAGWLLLLGLSLAPVPVQAVQPDEILTDSALESRARDLSSQLRCLVCQNQSIDDSDASLARDIRLLVRDRLKAGDSDAQVRDFLVQRYGAFVLLKPPFEASTMLLWGTPLLVLVLGGIGILFSLKRHRRDRDPSVPLSDAERARLDEIVARD